MFFTECSLKRPVFLRIDCWDIVERTNKARCSRTLGRQEQRRRQPAGTGQWYLTLEPKILILFYKLNGQTARKKHIQGIWPDSFDLS